MRGVNKAIILGNIGTDPETRYLPSGVPVTNFSVATNEKWTDKNTGEQKESTEWHRIATFGNLAEIAAQYLRKGKPVYIEGKIRTRKWQDQHGHDRWSTEIIANQLQMLGKKEEDDQPPAEAPQENKNDGRYTDDDFDEDIPF